MVGWWAEKMAFSWVGSLVAHLAERWDLVSVVHLAHSTVLLMAALTADRTVVKKAAHMAASKVCWVDKMAAKKVLPTAVQMADCSVVS